MSFKSEIVNFMAWTLGASWRTTLLGFAESVLVVLLDYIATHAMGDTPESQKVWWGGLGLALVMLVKGRLTKDVNVSHSPDPLPQSEAVIKKDSQ